MQDNYAPQSINLKVYAGLAAQALRAGHTAAYAVWTLARSIDLEGSGRVWDADLRSAAATRAEWDDRKYRRARADAIHLGMMTLVGGRLYLCSLAKAACKLGAQRIGRTPIGVSVRTLSTVKSWRTALRDAFLAGQKPNPISQKTIEVVTGLTPRTQYRYSKMNRARIKVIHNYARLQQRFDLAQLANIKEFVPGAYLKGGDLWRTLPNTYDVSEEHYPRLRPGRTRRAQSSLNALVNNAAGQRSIVRPARRYYETSEAAFKTLKRGGRGQLSLPDQLYVLARVRLSANDRPLFALWTAYPE